jgi:hypothetical protein
MELARLFDELVRLAERADIGVRLELLRPPPSDARSRRGGLCTIGGKRFIMVDERGALPDRIATLASALGGAGVDLSGLDPVVRATLGAYRRRRQAGDPDEQGDRLPSEGKRPLAKGQITPKRKSSRSDPDV